MRCREIGSMNWNSPMSIQNPLVRDRTFEAELAEMAIQGKHSLTGYSPLSLWFIDWKNTIKDWINIRDRINPFSRLSRYNGEPDQNRHCSLSLQLAERKPN